MASAVNAEETLAPAKGRSADVSFDLIVATLGYGAQVAKLVVPHVGVRASGTYFTFSQTTSQTDIDFDVNLKLQSFSGLLDLFPWSRGSFRFTTGVLLNRSTADGRGVCSGTIDLNDRSYTCAQIGTLTGSVGFPSASPYAGLGFGTPARGSRVHFVMDLGGAFGKPTLALSASNAGSNSQLVADIRAQRDKIQKDIDKYAKVYPVVSLGLGVRF